MTIDEAIREFEHMGKILKIQTDGKNTDYLQLAEWLRELKKLRAEQREVYENGYEEGYSDGFSKCLDLNV